MRHLLEALLDVVITQLLVIVTLSMIELEHLRHIAVTQVMPHLPVAIVAAVIVEAVKLFFFH